MNNSKSSSYRNARKGMKLLRVMTLNLRFPNPNDGENIWYLRRELVTRIILRYMPALLATEEGTPEQLRYLERALTGYRLFTHHRVWDDTCQYPSIFYKLSEILAYDGGEFWLSETPGVHLSKNWETAFPRLLSYVRVQHAGTRKYFWFAATHLDNISANARFHQAQMIKDWIGEKDDPVILAGDFNDIPDSDVHKLLVKPTGPLFDTWRVLAKTEDKSSLTHHGFTGVPQWGRIDWILTDEHFWVVSADLARESWHGRFPSDHFPYWVDLGNS